MVSSKFGVLRRVPGACVSFTGRLLPRANAGWHRLIVWLKEPEPFLYREPYRDRGCGHHLV
jgi:hypothetical protein